MSRKAEEPKNASRARIAGIILAAGGSSRFGAPKQLLTHHGENLVRRAARAAIEARLRPVIIVLGAYAPSVELFVADLDAVVAVNQDWQSGQASSLRTGIERAIHERCDAALVMLADQPLIDSASIALLVERYAEGSQIVASRYSGVLGAPAIFGSKHFEKLLALAGDHGAGKWLRANPDLVSAVDIVEAAVDIDTPDDLKHLPT